LEGIQASLPTGYIEEDDQDDDGGDQEIRGKGIADSEEIEVALSALVSIVCERLEIPVEPSSLSDLLESIFSPEDDVVSVAVNLEDAINGYFGELFGEDLDLADTYFSDLIELLKERREKWKHRKR
jgi:hypothetical protein